MTWARPHTSPEVQRVPELYLPYNPCRSSLTQSSYIALPAVSKIYHNITITFNAMCLKIKHGLASSISCVKLFAHLTKKIFNAVLFHF